jgi:hypothetical protein
MMATQLDLFGAPSAPGPASSTTAKPAPRRSPAADFAADVAAVPDDFRFLGAQRTHDPPLAVRLCVPL